MHACSPDFPSRGSERTEGGIELRQLRYLLGVVDFGGFRKAAEELCVAQPPLSQQIASLERELGVKLFDRTARGSTPTDAAKRLLPHIRRIVETANFTVAVSHNLRDGNEGILKLGFVGSAAFHVLPQLVTAHQERWPRVQFDLQEIPNHRQIERIRDGQLDAGLLRTDTTYAGMDSIWLFDEPILAALPSTHALADEPALALNDLSHESFIGIDREKSPQLFQDMAMLCRLAGFRYQPERWGAEFTTILGLAATGLGVALVPRSLTAVRLPGIRFVPLSDDFAHSAIHLVYPRAELSRLCAHLVQTAQELSGTFSAALVTD